METENKIIIVMKGCKISISNLSDKNLEELQTVIYSQLKKQNKS